MCALSATALAFSSIDPFNTEALTPPRPQLIINSEPAGANELNPGPNPMLNPMFNPAAQSFTPCIAPTANTIYSVLEVVDLALCQNPQTHEAWANARAQAALVGVAQSDYLPNLDGKATTNRTRLNGNNSKPQSASLTLSWLLYDFGARSANLENARQLLSAASSTLNATVQNVFLQALQAYYNTQAARAAVSAALETERASRESLNAAEVRYKVGTGTPADRLLAQTAWSQATLTRIKTEGVLQNAYGTLANVMGLDASQPIKLAQLPPYKPDSDFERNVDALIAEARLRRPDLKSAEAQVKAAQSNVDYVRASGLPTLSLSAGPSWAETGGRVTNNNNNFTSHGDNIGLTLTLPIFSGFDTTYRVRNAQARADAVGAQRDSVNLQVALDVWTAYQSLSTATQSVKTSADLLASAEHSERVALGRYKAGVGNILDVLNAQSALAAARLQRIQAQLDWYVFRASLAKAIGILDSSLLSPNAPLGTKQP